MCAADLGQASCPESQRMDEKDFKKHLQDLVHGHHHPEEHDWAEAGRSPAKTPAPKSPAKSATRKRKRPAK
jgi:hypothetical protein